MATQRASASKATDAEKEPGAEKATEGTDTSVNKVAPQDGPEHGYIGQAHPDKNRDDYTVAGVTGGTAKADNKPQDGEDIRQAWAPLRS